jgi:hypothetical protein
LLGPTKSSALDVWGTTWRSRKTWRITIEGRRFSYSAFTDDNAGIASTRLRTLGTAHPMKLELALDTIEQILDQERKKPSVRYLQYSVQGPSPTLYVLSPYQYEFPRDSRPRSVRPNTAEVSFDSQHYRLMEEVANRVEGDEVPSVLKAVRARLFDASSFERQTGDVLRSGQASQCRSELPLAIEFLARIGAQDYLIEGLSTAAFSPGLTLMLLELEDMIAFDYELFNTNQYDRVVRGLGELERRALEYQSQPRSKRDSATSNTVHHVGKEVREQIKNVSEVCRQAKFLHSTKALEPVPETKPQTVRTAGERTNLDDSKPTEAVVIDQRVSPITSNLKLLHQDLHGYGHYFREGKTTEAVKSAFGRVENLLNELRDSVPNPPAASGVALPHKLFDMGLLQLPHSRLAPGNPQRRNAYELAFKNFIASGIGWFRNSFDHEPHNLPDIDEAQAIELLFVASHMLRMIDDARAAANEQSPGLKK